MHSQYEHERQVKVIINWYHREAVNAEQRRLARAGGSITLSTLTMRLGSTLMAMLGVVRVGIHRIPAASPELGCESSPNAAQGVIVEPTGATVSV
jgi:hypothetical protein